MTNAVTINVNGKDFIVHAPRIGHNGGVYHVYFGTRDGKRFGPIRHASESGGPKTVGRQLAVKARDHFGPEVVAAEYAREIASLRKRIAEIDSASRWAESETEFYGKQLAAVEAAAA